jgi:hypothetical protein
MFKREEAKRQVEQEVLARIDGIFELLHHRGVAE